jgi:hypothetical protein
LVVIGLVIGASLGLGSGYVLVLPGMVNTRIGDLTARVEAMEKAVNEMDTEIKDFNVSVSIINEHLNEIIALTDTVEALSDQVGTLSTDLTNARDSLNSMESGFQETQADFEIIQDDWEHTLDNFETLQTSVNTVRLEMEDLQVQLEESRAILLFKAEIAKPPNTLTDDMTDSLFETLRNGNAQFQTWVADIGEDTARLLLEPVVYSQGSSFNWVLKSVAKVGSTTYQVQLTAYFPLEITPASITVSKLSLTIRGTVQIETEAVTIQTVSSELIK